MPNFFKLDFCYTNMRKIQSQTELGKKQKKKQIIVGVVLVGLLVLSTLGYSLLSGDRDEKSKQKYGGFEFVKQNNYWTLDIEGKVFYFQYLPQEVDDVSVSGSYNLQNYGNKVLYFVNLDSRAGQEILNNLERYVLRAQEACLEDLNCSKDSPVKTCDDNLIIFEEQNSINNKTQVYQDANCVYISEDYVKGADAFLYRILGIR